MNMMMLLAAMAFFSLVIALGLALAISYSIRRMDGSSLPINAEDDGDFIG